jgi:hypothetical protein
MPSLSRLLLPLSISVPSVGVVVSKVAAEDDKKEVVLKR